MRVIYMGKDKASVISGLEYLLSRGIKITLVVASPKIVGKKEPQLRDIAIINKIPVVNDNYIYKELSKPIVKINSKLKNIDLVISFLYFKRIKKSLLNLSKSGCINLHPAPLPDYRGVGGYNMAILYNLESWGVTAHFVDESIDTGDVIRVNKFKINPLNETAKSLETKSQIHLLKLFKETVHDFQKNKKIVRKKQGKGIYISFKDFERLRRINVTDSSVEIDKKIRAFWFPPYPGAFIEIRGVEYTLVNNYVLKSIDK